MYVFINLLICPVCPVVRCSRRKGQQGVVFTTYMDNFYAHLWPVTEIHDEEFQD